MRKLFLLFTLALFSGCATTPPLSTSKDTLFDVSGRIGVRHGNQGFSGSMRWIHKTAGDELWLLSPIGQTVAHITRNSQGAVLSTSDRKEYRAADVGGLTEKVLGWHLPLSGLDSWIMGKPFPESPSGAIPGEDEFVQNGWDIRYEKRFENGHPKVMVLERPGLRIKLIVNPNE